jgi:hypothetical protein
MFSLEPIQVMTIKVKQVTNYIEGIPMISEEEIPVQHPQVRVSPGGILMTNIDWYNLNKEEDIIVEHRVNGRLREQNRRDVYERTDNCWLPFTSYPTLTAMLGIKLAEIDLYDGRHRLSWLDSLQINHIHDWHSMCISSDSYGLHTWHVRRQSAHPDTNDTVEDSVRVQSSLVEAVWVTPAYSSWLVGTDEGQSYRELFQHCFNGSERIGSDDCLGQDSISSFVNWYMFVDRIFVNFMLLVVLFLFVYLLARWMLIVGYLLTLLLRDVIKGTVTTLSAVPLAENEGHRTQAQEYDYDVFLAYAEEDNDAARVVISVLLSFGLRVFDSHCDLPVNRQPTAVWDAALEQSRCAVVLVSQAYFSDNLLSAQFRSIYDCLMHPHFTSQSLLLIRLNKCQLPQSLGPLPIINFDQQNWRQPLEWWTISAFFSLVRAVKHSAADRTLGVKAVVWQALKDFGRDVCQSAQFLLLQPFITHSATARENIPLQHNMNLPGLQAWQELCYGRDVG